MNNAVFGISAAGLLVFFLRNPEKQNGLQPEIMRATRFTDNFLERKLKNARHALNRASFVDLCADEERQNEIVRGDIGFADEIAQSQGTSQSPRAVDQFPHGARLRVWGERRKMRPGDGRDARHGRVRPTGGLDAMRRSMSALR